MVMKEEKEMMVKDQRMIKEKPKVKSHRSNEDNESFHIFAVFYVI